MKALLQAKFCDWRSLRLAVVLALAAAWFVAPNSFVLAQQPDGDFEGEHTFKQADGQVVQLTEPKTAAQKIGGILRNGKTASAEEEKHFNDFFRYRLAEMTWKENITTLPKKRKDLKTRYIGPAGRGAAPDLHNRLNRLILDEFQKVAKDARYPRAVRLNCLLMIGELDQREPPLGASPPAIPLPEAEPVLFGIFKDESQHDALRIEALIGLKRHAESNLPADQRAELVSAMTKLLKSKEPAKGKSPVGHQWMRMLACDMLATLADKGAEANQPEVADAFQTLISEKSSDLWLRCHAAGEMGYLQSKAFPQDKVMPLAQRMADLVVEVAQTNDRLMANAGLNAQKAKAAAKPAPARLNADKKDDKAKKDGDEKEEEAPVAPAIPESVLKAAASDVAGQLIRIRYGLNGAEVSDRNAQPSTDHALYAAGDQAGKAFIKDVVARIDNMLKLLRDKKELYEQLANISTEGGDMQNWLKQQGAGAEQKPEKQPDKVVAPGAKPPASSSTKRPSGSKSAAESTVGQE